MEKKITIEDIREALQSLLSNNGNYKHYKDGRHFTELIKNAMIELKLKCDVQYDPEYYKIDHTFWNVYSDQEAAADLGLKEYKWHLLALIEHENDSKDWNYEVLKLAPFHCPLRVVIGYRNDKSSDTERLEYVCGLLQDMKDANCFCDTNEFWIVFGNTGQGKADYKFYKYNQENQSFIYEDKYDC